MLGIANSLSGSYIHLKSKASTNFPRRFPVESSIYLGCGLPIAIVDAVYDVMPAV